MKSLKERLERLVTRTREASPLADRAWFAIMHFVRAGGSRQAAATTYFAFLSFFPVLALAFFAVGLIARVYPDAKGNLETAIESFFPGIIGPDGADVRSASSSPMPVAVGIIGLVGVLYAGLGWLSGHARCALGHARHRARGSTQLPRRQAARPDDARAARRHAHRLGRAEQRGERLQLQARRVARVRPRQPVAVATALAARHRAGDRRDEPALPHPLPDPRPSGDRTEVPVAGRPSGCGALRGPEVGCR